MRLHYGLRLRLLLFRYVGTYVGASGFTGGTNSLIPGRELLPTAAY